MIEKIFLETSIQIRRIWGLPDERIKIGANLRNSDQIYTSSYCFAEYNRTILQDLKCLLEIVESNSKDNETIRFADLFYQIKKTQEEERIHLTQRRFERLLQIGAAFFLGSNRAIYHRDEFLVYLKLLISSEGIRMFFCVEVVAPNGAGNLEIQIKPVQYIEKIKCDLIPSDTKSPGQKENHKVCERLSCNRETAECNLKDFVKQHEAKFSKMEANLRSELKNIEKSKGKNNPTYRHFKVIEEVFDDLRNPGGNYNLSKIHGQKNCWRLGDFLIVLEAYKIAPIYTKDKIYKVICEPGELYSEE